MIPVIVIVDEANMNEVYRLDEPGEGERFFQNMKCNEELKKKREFYIDEYTEAQLKRCEIAGDYEGGHIDHDEYERKLKELEESK